jgi:putative OPT family oligopeptide transporter
MAITPYISAQRSVAELTFRSIIIAIFLTIILAMANAYLALKLGILTSASIPAAIISMGILRFFKDSTILENNAVQTAASAGEAVAGGIVYTIPGLIIIGFWDHFDYFTNFSIAAIGGILGVLFSIPLRKILVHDETLKFPEGRAIAEVLKSSAEKYSLKDIVYGGLVGATLELLQMGFKVLASSWDYWFTIKRAVFAVGTGFSGTMIGAGYLIGFDMAFSIILGAIISWGIALPVVSLYFPEYILHHNPQEAAQLVWNNQLRYLGIGAMLFAGVWTFVKLAKPLLNNISLSISQFKEKKSGARILRTEKDIPFIFILIGVILMALVLFLFFQFLFPLQTPDITKWTALYTILFGVIYVLVFGFLFSVITGYFSGMVGVSASPGSSIVIAGVLFAAWMLLSLLTHFLPIPLTSAQMKAAEAITIIIGSIVTGIAAISNDNTQDLKVGHLVGATPWKQEIMLLLGVLVSALVIPPVMQLLFNVYGIAGVAPHASMDLSQTLPAPTAALLAAITESVFNHSLPWLMMCLGGSIIFLFILLNWRFKLERYIQISLLGLAIGMYLPLATSFPLFIGGLIALLVNKQLSKTQLSLEKVEPQKQVGTLLACGLLAGAALMDVALAVPFSLMHSPDALRVVGEKWNNYSVLLSVFTTMGLGYWFLLRVSSFRSNKA